MGHTRTRGHKCLLYDGAWRPLELHWLSSRAHRIAWFVPNYWWCWKQTILIYFEIQPQPTFQEGMLERTLKEWIQPEMTREFLPQQSHEVWSEEARNTHISNTLRAVDDQRPIFQQYPAISSNIQQWSFITWWFGVEPCSPSKGSFHNPRCQDTRRSLAAPSGDKAWAIGFELLTLCGWAYLRRGQRSMVRHFIPAAWVTFQVGHGGTENQVLIWWSSWKNEGQWWGMAEHHD